MNEIAAGDIEQILDWVNGDIKEPLIKSGAQIAQSDLTSDCAKISQAGSRLSRNFGAI